MSEEKHEAEPWYTTVMGGIFSDDDGVDAANRFLQIIRKNGPITRIVNLRNRYNLERISLCVNALAGIDTETLRSLSEKNPDSARLMVKHFEDRLQRIKEGRPPIDTPKIMIKPK
jgi:hypothetical protein